MSLSRPSNVEYAELMRTWADAVLGWFLWIADSDTERGLGYQVTEAWVGLDFRLYIRQVDGDVRLGTGLGRIDENPAAALPLNPTAYRVSGSSASGIATYLYHSWFATGPQPGDVTWVDPQGYGWWGAEPPGGWESGVLGPRFTTARGG